jgi:hypothetical protein
MSQKFLPYGRGNDISGIKKAITAGRMGEMVDIKWSHKVFV